MRKASLRLVVKYDYKLLEWGPETVGNALPPLLVLEIVSLEACGALNGKAPRTLDIMHFYSGSISLDPNDLSYLENRFILESIEVCKIFHCRTKLGCYGPQRFALFDCMIV